MSDNTKTSDIDAGWYLRDEMREMEHKLLLTEVERDHLEQQYEELCKRQVDMARKLEDLQMENNFLRGWAAKATQEKSDAVTSNKTKNIRASGHRCQ